MRHSILMVDSKSCTHEIPSNLGPKAQELKKKNLKKVTLNSESIARFSPALKIHFNVTGQKSSRYEINCGPS